MLLIDFLNSILALFHYLDLSKIQLLRRTANFSIKNCIILKKKMNWVVVVAQLAEQSIPTPKTRGLNPVIANFILNICLLSTGLKCIPMREDQLTNQS